VLGGGMPEIILILIIALVLFGSSKLPEIGSAAGKAIREFKVAVKPAENLLKLERTEAKLPDPIASGSDRKG